MADNITLNPGSGGAPCATDDVGGIQHQRVKVEYGEDGFATDVSLTNPLPVLNQAGDNAIGRVKITDGTDVAQVSAGGAILTDASATTQPVSAASLPLPAGASTESTLSALNTKAPAQGQALMAASVPVVVASNQSAIPVSGTVTANAGTGPWPITDNAGSITVDNAGTFATQAAQSGTWTVQPGNTANTVAWKVDASSVAVPITDNGGSLTVDGTVATTNAGTFAVQDSQVITDNAAFTDGTSKVFPVGFIYDEVAGIALTENDVAAGRINVNRATVGVIEDGATRARYATVTAANAVKVDGSAVTQPVSGTFWQATQPVSGTVTANAGTGTMSTAETQLIADNAGFTDGTSKVLPAGFIYDEVAGTALTENDVAAARINVNRATVNAIEDGVTRGRYATVSAANALKVDGSAVTQPVSGTFWQATQPVSGTVSANATLSAETTKVIGTINVAASQTIAVTSATAANTKVEPAGDVAHDGVDSGNPLKVGAKAISSASALTLVASGDRTNVHADLDGAILSKVVPNADLLSERIADTGGTSTAFTNFGAVVGTRNYVTSIHIYNSSTTDGYVDFRDGAAGAVLFTAAAPAGGGMTLANPVPLFKSSANTAIAYDVSGALSTVFINISGYQSKA